MEMTFNNDGTISFDHVRIVYRNFEGREGPYNRKDDRNFSIVIPSEDIKNALVNDTNRYGVGWNVKVKPSREEGDAPFMTLPVKIKINRYGPNVYLETGRHTRKLDPENIGLIDRISIKDAFVDIRPYDQEIAGRAYRSAYLYSIKVVQDIDRFGEELAESEFPEE